MSRNQIRIEFTSKTPFAGGVSFGNTGPYERLLGMASLAIDPGEKDLPFVADLDLAPRNAEGLVEFKAVLDIVKPVDLSRGNRRLLCDFSNRGNRGAFTRLNDGGGSDLSKPMFINFHVAVPDKPSAKKLAAIAQKLGYRIKVFASPECVLRWTCECSTRMVAAYESVIAVQNELADLSEPFGGRPDGWSTFGNGPIGSPPVR